MSTLVEQSDRVDTTAPHIDRRPAAPAPAPAPWRVRLAQRQARLAELDAELAAKLTALNVASAEARATATAAKASIEAEHEAAFAAVESALANEAIEWFSAAIRDQYAEPTRARVRAVADKWSALCATSEAELGLPACHLILALAAGEAFGRRLPLTWRTHRVTSTDSSFVGDVCASLAKALAAGESGPADAALDRLATLTIKQPTDDTARIDQYRHCLTQPTFARTRERVRAS